MLARFFYFNSTSKFNKRRKDYMAYIVTYDLKRTETNQRADDYEKLYKELKSFYKYARLTESSWIVCTYRSVEEVKAQLEKVLRSDDAIFVGELTGWPEWANCIDYDYKIIEVLK